MPLNEFMTGYEPPVQEEFKPIPEGKYPAYIDGVKVKTNDNKHSYASITFKLFGDSHSGRLVWDNCWLTHSNPKANNVGKSKLYKLAKAAGIAPTSPEDAYIGKKVNIVLTVDGDKNNLKYVEAYEEQASAPEPTPPPPSVESADMAEEAEGEW